MEALGKIFVGVVVGPGAILCRIWWEREDALAHTWWEREDARIHAWRAEREKRK